MEQLNVEMEQLNVKMAQLKLKCKPKIRIQQTDRTVLVSFEGFTRSNYVPYSVQSYVPEHNVSNMDKLKMEVVFHECDVCMTFAEELSRLHERSSVRFCNIVGNFVISNCVASDEKVLDEMPFQWSHLTISALSYDISTFHLSPEFLNLSEKRKKQSFRSFTMVGHQFTMTPELSTAVSSMVTSCPHLNWLSFRDCDLPGAFIAQLYSVVVEKKLTLLDLSGSKLDTTSCEHLEDFFKYRGMGTPKRLCLHSTNITDVLLQKLSDGLATNSTLEELYCGGYRSVSATAWTRFFDKLAEAKSPRKLKMLDFDTHQIRSQFHQPGVHMSNNFNNEVATSISNAVRKLEQLHTLLLGTCLEITQSGWDSIFQEISKKKKWKELQVGNAYFNVSIEIVQQFNNNQVVVDKIIFSPLERGGWLGVFALLEGNACIKEMTFRVTSCIDDEIIIALANAARRNQHTKRLDFHCKSQIENLKSITKLMTLLFCEGKLMPTVTMSFCDSDEEAVRARITAPAQRK